MPPSIEYIAGFFDGEGHIGVYKRQTDGRTDYQWALVITNTNRGVLEEIHRALNLGIGHINSAKRAKESHAVCWRLYIGGRKRFVQVLTMLLPYLIVKRDQAEEALALARSEERIFIPTECKEDGCNRFVLARGWCSMHYQRFYQVPRYRARQAAMLKSDY